MALTVEGEGGEQDEPNLLPTHARAGCLSFSSDSSRQFCWPTLPGKHGLMTMHGTALVVQR